MGVSVFPPSSSGGGGAIEENDFFLTVGTTGNTSYVLNRAHDSGRYSIAFANGDTTYDIYAIAKDGSYAGYAKGTVIDISADFNEIVVLGAAASEVIHFTYEGVFSTPSATGDVVTAGAFVSGVVTSSLPNADDTTVVNGGNFASNVAVSFIDQSSTERPAKNVVRSSSTELVVTRPDVFSTADSPYTVKVENPGVPLPSGTNAHLLAESVTAGTNPAWQTTGNLPYNISAATPEITLLATDVEGSDMDYSVVSGTLPAGLALDGETGVISGTFSGSASEGDSNSVTFRAIDAGGNFLNKAFDFVANAAPVWSTAEGAITLSPYTGAAYNFQLVASGGSIGEVLTYALQSGSLHPGLSLSTSGEITGEPTDAVGSVATFTIRVTDSVSAFTDRVFTTTVMDKVTATGGDVSTVNGYKYHTFTSAGTFTLTSGNDPVDVLIIAGGGGLKQAYGGGGGAGGYIAETMTLAAGDYALTVGTGGGGGANGGDTSFLDYTAIGGGAGCTYGSGNANSGGSGGGNMGGTRAAGTAGQGNPGGISATPHSAGGGGGAGAQGGDADYYAGSGGAGLTWLNGTTYAGGGGGGTGTNRGGRPGGSGNANAGGGGNATGYNSGSGSDGKNGIVIVRYVA